MMSPTTMNNPGLESGEPTLLDEIQRELLKAVGAAGPRAELRPQEHREDDVGTTRRVAVPVLQAEQHRCGTR